MSESFGERLKKYRESKELSQDQLAEILNTSKQVISRYETNQRTPKISVAQEYAEKLGIPLTYLVSGEEPEQNHDVYYLDPEIAAMAQELKDNPDMRILLDASKNMKKEEMLALINFIKSMKGEQE